MKQLILASVGALALSACGLAGTAASTAAGGEAAAAQAKAGLQTEARVKQQLAAAAALDAQHRQAADPASQ